MFQRPELCWTNRPAHAASSDTHCALRTVVTIGRVRPPRVVGFCAGCEPPRFLGAADAGGSGPKKSAGLFGQSRASSATMSTAP
jgi:hypothetical protein